jgi:type II secretory pathway component PulF
LFANLYRTGEVSGQIDQTLDRLHHHYQEEGSRRVHLIAQWLPRLIYLLILIAVAIQIIGFWTGYYDNILRQAE